MATRPRDPFLLNYSVTELKIASEFLSTWLPFLSRGLCRRCTKTLSDRVRSFEPGIDGDVDVGKQAEDFAVLAPKDSDVNECYEEHDVCDAHSVGSWKDSGDIYDKADTNSLGSWQDAAEVTLGLVAEASSSETFTLYAPTETRSVKMSWADMAQEDELEPEGESEVSSSQLVKGNGSSGQRTEVNESKPKVELSREQRELLRFRNVKREKDFICFERVNGKFVNILDGLELHTGVFSAAEQKRIVNFVEELQELGKNGQLRERTYTAPQKWMRGKGRVTIQFGCCYNYATDKNGNPPGILQNGTVDPLPQLFKVMIKRLVRWHVMPPSCVPDSCIVNIYDEGDCIPPHIDSHDFVRPFCTISFISECNIVFGTSLKVLDAGVFAGSVAIPLPVGSVLVLNGNGADVAKHCVPSVPTKRISITFRKMDESKRPVGFVPEPDLQGLQPLSYEADNSKISISSKPRQSLETQANHREKNWDKGNGSRERSSESRHPIKTRRGPMNRRRVTKNVEN